MAHPLVNVEERAEHAVFVLALLFQLRMLVIGDHLPGPTPIDDAVSSDPVPLLGEFFDTEALLFVA